MVEDEMRLAAVRRMHGGSLQRCETDAVARSDVGPPPGR